MRFASRLILTILMLAMPVGGLRAVPLDCTTVIVAAPTSCSGSACCCKDSGACLCPRPVAPPTPSAPPAPALTSGGVEMPAEACTTWDFAAFVTAPKAGCDAQATTAAPATALDVLLCVLQV